MNNSQAISLVVLVSLLLGCGTNDTASFTTEAIQVLEATRAKIADNATHRYQYVSFWDNRFARSTYEDSMHITYTNLPGSQLGFAFFAQGNDYDVLYDGTDNLFIDHQKREVVRTPAADIAGDSAYFDNKMFFLAHPRKLPAVEALSNVSSVLESGKKLWTYEISTQAPNSNSPKDTIYTTQTYFIEATEALLTRVRTVSRSQQDTFQVIEYNFKDYSFDQAPYRFSERDREKSLGYREINPATAESQRLAGLIKVGNQLNRADYPDVNGQEQVIYGIPGKKSVIMFSFIGCGGCEYALREMKKKNFATPPDLNFYYSSPVDEPSAIQTYLDKKAFPHPGFGKNSRMNDVFHVAAFPTFVFVGESGEIERVIGGYDDEVEALVLGQ